MTTFTAYDLSAEKYNGAYTGMLNLHNYSDSFKVVGIADKKEVQMYMYDETYDEIRNDFFTDCILDVYGIKTNGKQISKYVDSSYRDGVYVDHPLADAVVSVYQVKFIGKIWSANHNCFCNAQHSVKSGVYII